MIILVGSSGSQIWNGSLALNHQRLQNLNVQQGRP